MINRRKKMQEVTLEWMLSNTVPDGNGCMNWSGRIMGEGYGVLTINKKSCLSHRVVYSLVHGTIPDGKIVMHSCDNRMCINPDHLSIGTNTDNVKDKIMKNRSGSTTKRLTEDEALYILNSNQLNKDLAKQFGISARMVRYIRSRTLWASLT